MPWLSCLLLVCAVIALGAEPAHAYLDPTSGSVILQALVGGLVAGLYVLRTSWDKIKSRFRRREDDPKAPS
jgi:hypothetical protein